MLKENDSSGGITEFKFLGISVLPVCTASVSVIASKMSADGFNSPSWIILVLSSWELLHCGYTKVITFKKKYITKVEKHLKEFSMLDKSAS